MDKKICKNTCKLFKNWKHVFKIVYHTRPWFSKGLYKESKILIHTPKLWFPSCMNLLHFFKLIPLCFCFPLLLNHPFSSLVEFVSFYLGHTSFLIIIIRFYLLYLFGQSQLIDLNASMNLLSLVCLEQRKENLPRLLNQVKAKHLKSC